MASRIHDETPANPPPAVVFPDDRFEWIGRDGDGFPAIVDEAIEALLESLLHVVTHRTPSPLHHPAQLARRWTIRGERESPGRPPRKRNAGSEPDAPRPSGGG